MSLENGDGKKKKQDTNSVKLPAELQRSLDEIVEASGVSKSFLMRSWIEVIVRGDDFRPFFIRLFAMAVATLSPDYEVHEIEEAFKRGLEEE